LSLVHFISVALNTPLENKKACSRPTLRPSSP